MRQIRDSLDRREIRKPAVQSSKIAFFESRVRVIESANSHSVSKLHEKMTWSFRARSVRLNIALFIIRFGEN